MKYDFQRYLEAKRSLDARSVNARVWDMLVERLPDVHAILDAGCGTGALLPRLAQTGRLTPGGVYWGVDADQASLAIARERAHQMDVSDLETRFEFSDLFAFEPDERFDLVAAAAFLDLVDTPRAVRHLLGLLHPGGLGYFPINFDGLTIFDPPHPLDAQLIPCYHSSIQSGGGDHQAGRRLFSVFRDEGVTVLAAGSSDWVVHSGPDKSYPNQDAYFLRHILLFFETSLEGHPDLKTGQLDNWLAIRRAQVDAGELVYIAHQLDFLVQTGF
jgi:SAM-dependent methyltransferase